MYDDDDEEPFVLNEHHSYAEVDIFIQKIVIEIIIDRTFHSDLWFHGAELARRYPANVTVHEIGRTFEGRSIKMVKVKSFPASALIIMGITFAHSTDNKLKVAFEPQLTPVRAVWVDAGAHAREWTSVAACVRLVSQVIKNVPAR